MQLWINLAARDKMTAPRYQSLRGGEMPVRTEPGVAITLLSGTSGGVAAPTLNHVPVTALDVVLQPGASFEQRLAPSENGFVLVVEGEALIGRRKTPIRAGALAWLTRADDLIASIVTIAAPVTETRVLLFAGQPLREPVVFGGPFVMNTHAQVQQAFADYRAGRF